MSLGPRLRREDSEELLDHIPELSAAVALDLAREQSAVAIAWESNGLPIACGGVIDQGDKIGAGWLLSTPEALVSPRLFHRVAASCLAACAEHWNSVSACSRVDLVTHHRWLERLGFERLAEAQGYIWFGIYFD